MKTFIIKAMASGYVVSYSSSEVQREPTLRQELEKQYAHNQMPGSVIPYPTTTEVAFSTFTEASDYIRSLVDPNGGVPAVDTVAPANSAAVLDYDALYRRQSALGTAAQVLAGQSDYEAVIRAAIAFDDYMTGRDKAVPPETDQAERV